MSHIQDHIGPALTKASVGIGSLTSGLGLAGWIEQNAVVIGVCATVVFGLIGVFIQWKNYRMNRERINLDRRRVEAMEKQVEEQCDPH